MTSVFVPEALLLSSGTTEMHGLVWSCGLTKNVSARLPGSCSCQCEEWQSQYERGFLGFCHGERMRKRSFLSKSCWQVTGRSRDSHVGIFGGRKITLEPWGVEGLEKIIGHAEWQGPEEKDDHGKVVEEEDDSKRRSRFGRRKRKKTFRHGRKEGIDGVT